MKTPEAELERLVEEAGKKAKAMSKLRGMHPDCERGIEVCEAIEGYYAAAKSALKKGELNAAVTALQFQSSCVKAYISELAMFQPQLRSFLAEKGIEMPAPATRMIDLGELQFSSPQADIRSGRGRITEGGIQYKGMDALLKQYEVALGIEKWGEKKSFINNVNNILEPEEINRFLQVTIAYKAHEKYGNNTGLFVTRLIQNSYDAGYDSFRLDTRALKELHFIGWGARGKDGNPLEITIEGNAGEHCGDHAERLIISIAGNAGHFCAYEAEDSTITIGGDAGAYCGHDVKSSTISIGGNASKDCGWNAKSSTISIAGNARNACGFEAEDSRITIGGDAGDWCGSNAKRSIFKAKKPETLENMKKYVGTGKGNRIYFIQADGNEEELPEQEWGRIK